MDYSFLHETEAVRLRSEVRRKTSELLPVFLSHGFTLHDDVLSLDRQDEIPPWQHSAVVEVEVRRDSKEVFGFRRGEWNSILLQYLFASLPYELSSLFIETAFSISERLELPVEFHGQVVTMMQLQTKFEQVRDDLLLHTGEEAGSERLSILIHSTYPRS